MVELEGGKTYLKILHCLTNFLLAWQPSKYFQTTTSLSKLFCSPMNLELEWKKKFVCENEACGYNRYTSFFMLLNARKHSKPFHFMRVTNSCRNTHIVIQKTLSRLPISMQMLTTIFRPSRIQEWSKMRKRGSRKYWRMKMARLPSYTKPRRFVIAI